MALTTEQIREMRTQIRDERAAGRPEVAVHIQSALDRGEVYELVPIVAKEALPIPPVSGPGSGKEVWTAYALAESDLDEEVIESVNKKDLIQMLRANGIIPMPVAEEE